MGQGWQKTKGDQERAPRLCAYPSDKKEARLSTRRSIREKGTRRSVYERRAEDKRMRREKVRAGMTNVGITG